jgi:N-acetylglutamate synthase-like GNAT family acetyltransferase
MISSWLRFRWDLSALDTGEAIPNAPFHLRSAAKDDEDSTYKVISSAYFMESTSLDASKEFYAHLQERIRQVFSHEPVSGLLLLHGSRVIGASLLNPAHDAENNLLTGPCIVHEYRSRGLGSTLLKASLIALRDAGLKHAYGIVSDRTAAARFVYTKFGGASEPYEARGEDEPLLAA